MGRRNTFEDIWARVAWLCAEPDECWLWTGATDQNGYGRVGWQGKVVSVHRLVWEQKVGPIQDGLVIDHVAKKGCISRACCNPAHLEPVSQGVNIHRALYSEVCSQGHNDWYDRPDTRGRQCRTCQTDAQRRRRHHILN